MAYIEKHVEFTDELNINEEGKGNNQQQQKLHRRDTPHHLKNKRILSKNNDSITIDVSEPNDQVQSDLFPFSSSKLCHIVQRDHPSQVQEKT